MTPDSQLELATTTAPLDEVVEATVINGMLEPLTTTGGRLAECNLFGEADRIAARASSTSTRRQYAAIYRTFAHWLREQLGRPPLVGISMRT